MAKAIFYVEFENNMTPKEITENLRYYHVQSGRITITKINGVEVRSDDENLEEKVERLCLNLTEEEYQQKKEAELDIKRTEKKIASSERIERLEYFRYYFNLPKKYLKPECIEEYEEYISYSLSLDDEFIDILVLTSKLLLALERQSYTEIQISIEAAISSLSWEQKNKMDSANTLRLSLDIIRRYAKKGLIIDDFFGVGTTHNLNERMQTKLQELNNARILRKIINKKENNI